MLISYSFPVFAERYPNEVKKIAKTKLQNYEKGIFTIIFEILLSYVYKGTSQKKFECCGIQITRMMMIGFFLACLSGVIYHSWHS